MAHTSMHIALYKEAHTDRTREEHEAKILCAFESDINVTGGVPPNAFRVFRLYHWVFIIPHTNESTLDDNGEKINDINMY